MDSVALWALIISAVVLVAVIDDRHNKAHPERRIARDDKLRAALDAKAARASVAAVDDVVCPHCGHHEAQRITAGQRVSSGVAGGLIFSRAARASFRCGHCRGYF
jgi:transposase-like protein